MNSAMCCRLGWPEAACICCSHSSASGARSISRKRNGTGGGIGEVKGVGFAVKEGARCGKCYSYNDQLQLDPVWNICRTIVRTMFGDRVRETVFDNSVTRQVVQPLCHTHWRWISVSRNRGITFFILVSCLDVLPSCGRGCGKRVPAWPKLSRFCTVSALDHYHVCMNKKYRVWSSSPLQF